jgi:hypothetical protein
VFARDREVENFRLSGYGTTKDDHAFDPAIPFRDPALQGSHLVDRALILRGTPLGYFGAGGL